MHHDAKRWSLALVLAAACAGDADDDGTADETTGSTAATTTSTGLDTTSEEAGSSTAVADDSTTAGGTCIDELPAIVTDIDETLTLSDAEFFMQAQDPTYDPVEREGGAALIGAYADLGYRVLYLTARSENFDIANTDETAREITVRWLEEHGYPLDADTTLVLLAEDIVVGDSAQAYKAAALMEQQAMGWRFDYAYGNATSDIGAYEDAGIDKAVTFIIGEHAGEEGTVAIAGEGWVEHTDAHLPTVPAVCEAA